MRFSNQFSVSTILSLEQQAAIDESINPNSSDVNDFAAVEIYRVLGPQFFIIDT